MSEKKTTMPRMLRGVVTSDKMDKSIVVLVEGRVRHPIYGKYVKRSTKVHAHDAENTASTGDIVIVKECRPLSKTKCWELVEIKERAA